MDTGSEVLLGFAVLTAVWLAILLWLHRAPRRLPWPSELGYRRRRRYPASGTAIVKGQEHATITIQFNHAFEDSDIPYHRPSMEVRRLIVPTDIAFDTRVHKITTAGKVVFKNELGIAAQVFSEISTVPNFSFGVLKPGEAVEIEVSNRSAVEQHISLALIGEVFQ